MALSRASLVAVWLATVLVAGAHGASDDESHGLPVPQLKGVTDIPSQLRTLQQASGYYTQAGPNYGDGPAPSNYRPQAQSGVGQQGQRRRPSQGTRRTPKPAQQGGYRPAGAYSAQPGPYYSQSTGYAGHAGAYGGAYNPQSGYYPNQAGAYGGAYGAQVGPYGQAGPYADYQEELAEPESLFERVQHRIAEYRARPKAPFGDRLGNFARGVGSVVGVVGDVLDVAAKLKD